MSVLREPLDAIHAGAEEAQRALRASKEAQDREARERRNLTARAKRAGVSPSVQAQREWIKDNPCGFEILPRPRQVSNKQGQEPRKRG